ncbi:MAG: tetratricopeptide repeat protein [Cyclobacteriaceae bacterium]|nr:tetratricopeptide repeat protein [Cyclobacteriaceae bacterium]
MFKKTLYNGFILLTISFSVAGQIQLPDSLARFNTRKRDSAYVIELNKLANEYMKINPSASRKIALHSSETAQQINYLKGYARSLTVIGNSFWYEGVYDLAQNYYLQAARQYQSLDDSIGLGQTYNNLGEVYKRMGEYNKALDFLLRSIQLKKKDTLTRAITLYNIGELYNQTGRFNEAKKYFQQSLIHATKNNDQRTVAYTYWGFAVSALHEKDHNGAIAYFKQAEELYRRLGETRLLTQMYLDIADVYIELKQYPKAEAYLNEAHQLARQIRVPDLMVTNLLKHARLDSARGNYQQALKYLYQHNKMKDSVFNLVKSEQMARLQLAYETENRERENQQLRASNLLKENRLRTQQVVIAAIAGVLILAILLSWVLLRQRRKILSVNQMLKEKSAEIEQQKNELEIQAKAVASLNKELTELNKTLEDRIAERTRQLVLQNQKLIEYAYFNAHKLRAPVSSILGLITLLDQRLENDTQTIISHLRTCGEQLDAITREISGNIETGIIE